MFCVVASTKKTYQVSENTAAFGICPIDFYCPAGTGYPIPCGHGKFTNGLTGRWLETHCIACPGGTYCQALEGVSAAVLRNPNKVLLPTGGCDEGYYCPSGSKDPRPATTFCQAGNYCPKNSTVATQCAAGSYQPRIK